VPPSTASCSRINCCIAANCSRTTASIAEAGCACDGSCAATLGSGTAAARCGTAAATRAAKASSEGSSPSNCRKVTRTPNFALSCCTKRPRKSESKPNSKKLVPNCSVPMRSPESSSSNAANSRATGCVPALELWLGSVSFTAAASSVTDALGSIQYRVRANG